MTSFNFNTLLKHYRNTFDTELQLFITKTTYKELISKTEEKQWF